MATFPTEVTINERDIARLTHLYRTAYAQIEAEIEGASSFGIANRKGLQNQIDEILVDLDRQSSPIIKESIERQYTSGATDAIGQLKTAGAEDLPTSVQFNRIHKEAIESLVSDTQTAFAESIQGVHRSTSQLLGAGVRQQLTEQMALGKIKGEALQTIKRNVVGTLRERGLTSLQDRSGRSWTLDRYSEMLIRTKSVEARNMGMINRIAQEGYDLVQVSSHGAGDNCGDWEGKILSARGDTKGYPTVEDARSGGLFHPNCRHAVNVLVPELAKVTHAYNPNIDTMTGKEFIDQVDTTLKGKQAPLMQKAAPKTSSR